jgi:hypothetical protein
LYPYSDHAGVSFIVNLIQPEYLATAAQAAGAVVMVHEQVVFPFPELLGIMAPPGHLTSIGIKQVMHNMPKAFNYMSNIAYGRFFLNLLLRY